MNDQMADLNVLEKRFQDEIGALENRLAELKRRFNIVTEAIGLLKEGGTFNQDKLFPMPEIISDKYKNMSMRNAIVDVLLSYHGKKVTADVILSDLTKNGFVSKAKNFKRDVYTRLFRLKKSGILGSSRKEGGLNKYYLKEEKIEEDARNEKGGI